MRKSVLAAAAAALLALSACSSAEEPTTPETVSATVAPADQEETTAPPVASTKVDDSTPKAEEPEPAGEVVIEDVGIGQDGEYAWAAALVKTSGHVGEYLTVHFNVFDEADELIASGEQVEEIVSEQSTMAVGTQVEVGDSRAARVDATYAVSDYGMGAKALPEIPPAPATLGEYSSLTAHLTNDTSEPWENLRVGIICRNAGGAIVGGGSAFPQLVPANSESMADGYGITSDDATECTAYPQHSAY